MIPKEFTPAAGLLAGRVILITGAGSGLGRALSLECARAGASVILCGRNGAKPRPDKAGGARVVDPRVEVVAAEHGVEPGLLGRHGLIDQVFGLVGLVAAQPGELHLRLHRRVRQSRSSHYPHGHGAGG